MRKTALFLSLLTLSFSTSFSQPAEPSPDRPHHMFAELGLTAEQKEKLKVLHSEMAAARKRNFEAVRSVRDKIKEELLKEKPSKSTLDSHAGELGNLHKEITNVRHEHLLKVKQILTAEQFSKMVNKEWRGGRKAFKHGKAGKCPESRAAKCKMQQEM